MDGAGGAAFRLQFDDGGDAAPQVLAALGGPFVGKLPHAGGGGDRVNGDHFGNAVSHVGDGFVAVYRKHAVHA